MEKKDGREGRRREEREKKGGAERRKERKGETDIAGGNASEAIAVVGKEMQKCQEQF